MKSPITYYGGKTSMLPNILPIIPPHKVYTEVFFGGGAVFFAKDAVKNETINDKLGIVVNFYEQLKTNYKNLKKLIDATLFCRDHHERALLIIYNRHLFTPVEKAWAFWMCSNFSYGNKIGGGLKYSNDISIVPPRVMQNYKAKFTEHLAHRIENVHIENRDACLVLKSRNVENAFHFVDPPYPNADQGHYKGYTFSDLEVLLQQLEKIKGNFILSNYNSEMLTSFIEKNKWYKQEFTFNNKGMRKHEVTKLEVLVSNFEPLQKLKLFEDQ